MGLLLFLAVVLAAVGARAARCANLTGMYLSLSFSLLLVLTVKDPEEIAVMAASSLGSRNPCDDMFVNRGW